MAQVMMLSGSLTHHCTALLIAAQDMHLTDTSTALGPFVIVCPGDANVYVEPDAPERLLNSFCADD